MSQRNASGSLLRPQFSFLTLSLVMGMGLSFQVHAQDAVVDSQEEVVTAVPANLVSAQAETQTQTVAVPQTLVAAPIQSAPVQIAPAMRATPVPVNVSNTASDVRQDSSSGYADMSTGYADASEIDSSKNSNGSGIQIFNLNNNKPTQDQLNDQNTGTRADLLRRERIRQELLNENRLIEKIEEDRIGTEGVRSGSIAGMQFTTGTSATSTAIAAASANNDGLEEVQVSAVATASTASAPMVSTSASSFDNRFSSTEFKISPMGGYRWTPDNDSVFRSANQGIAGVAVEGRLANVLGLEVSYLYGRDKLRDRSLSPYAYGGAGYGGYQQNIYQPAFNQGYSAQQYGFIGNIRTRDTHEFGAAIKLGWFVGQVRPYALGGIGTRYTDYNIDNSADRASAAAMGWKRSSVRMTSTAGGGLDYRLAQNLSIGSRVEWQYVMGRKEDASLGGNNIINLYGDTKNTVKAMGSLQLVF